MSLCEIERLYQEHERLRRVLRPLGYANGNGIEIIDVVIIGWFRSRRLVGVDIFHLQRSPSTIA
jgi:hypothetical protein